MYMIILKTNFPLMRALEFVTGHMVYNVAYILNLQTTTTIDGLYLKSNICQPKFCKIHSSRQAESIHVTKHRVLL